MWKNSSASINDSKSAPTQTLASIINPCEWAILDIPVQDSRWPVLSNIMWFVTQQWVTKTHPSSHGIKLLKPPSAEKEIIFCSILNANKCAFVTFCHCTDTNKIFKQYSKLDGMLMIRWKCFWVSRTLQQYFRQNFSYNLSIFYVSILYICDFRDIIMSMKVRCKFLFSIFL